MTDLGIDGLKVFETPGLLRPTLLLAFSGWPDAGDVATGSLRYLVAATSAKRFARLDHEEFYQMSSQRPLVVVEGGEYKGLRFPSNDFYYHVGHGSGQGIIFFLGTEPHLKWRKYCDTLLEVARQFEVERCIMLGGMFDALPHTWDPRVSGAASTSGLRAELRNLGVSMVDYQGPSSVHSVLSIAFARAGLETLSLWGHAPLYVRTTANPKVCHAILTRVCALASLSLSLEGLKAAGEFLDDALNRMLLENAELRLFVNKLKDQAEGHTQVSPLEEEETEKIIREVEEFLRKEHKKRESDDS